MPVRVSELLTLAKESGLAIEYLEKSRFHKVGVGPLRLYVAGSKTDTCHRVDLSGPFELSHPAITPLSPSEAARKHLGRVTGQIDVKKPRDVVLDAWQAALAIASAVKPNSRDEGSDDGGPSVLLALRLKADLNSAIEQQQRQMNNEVPRGVLVSREEAIYVLLWEAIEARLAGQR